MKDFDSRGRAGMALALMAAWALSACGGGGTAASSSGVSTSTAAALSAQAALGEKIFNDTSLSASGRQACATCHVAANGHAADNDLPAQMGGVMLELQGHRSSPSIRYLSTNTAFFFDAEGTPTGGFFWDGRASSLQDQAGRPFTNPVEMANTDVASVVDKLSKATYAADFKKAFGEDIFSRPDDAFARMTLALQKFEQEDPAFHPFTSKFDDMLRGKATFTEQELRGFALFNNPAKGNCAACHPATKSADGSHPLFTDFTYDNLGIPRNPDLLHNANPAFFDLGLCARENGDLLTRADLCGAFKVPSLRNVALRKSFFHNGRFKTLKDALTFYVQRDTNPEKFYSRNADGSINKFDDLPAPYKANVNVTEVPYNRKPGDAPALSDAEIDDLIAFLQTLTDGYAH
ncbi:cytochrome-c peroxidase [Piscinibacter terrae]|nr:cytochrome c peroxidase [Albitalea terrae]